MSALNEPQQDTTIPFWRFLAQKLFARQWEAMAAHEVAATNHPTMLTVDDCPWVCRGRGCSLGWLLCGVWPLGCQPHKVGFAEVVAPPSAAARQIPFPDGPTKVPRNYSSQHDQLMGWYIDFLRMPLPNPCMANSNCHILPKWSWTHILFCEIHVWVDCDEH